jgi:hypothetical protein
MHLSSLLPAFLVALSAGALSLDTATGENIAAIDALVPRRTAFQRLQCGAVHIFDEAACQTVQRYRVACLLVVEVKYQNCRRRASNDIPNDILGRADEPTCPPTCGAAVKTCAKNCVSFGSTYSILLLILVLTHIIRTLSHPKLYQSLALSNA